MIYKKHYNPIQSLLKFAWLLVVSTMCENFFHQILVFQHFYFFQVESEKRKRLVGLIQLIFLLLNIEINQVQFWTCENTSSAPLKAINFKLND